MRGPSSATHARCSPNAMARAGSTATTSPPDDMFLALLHTSDWAHCLLSPADDHAPSMEWLDVVKR